MATQTVRGIDVDYELRTPETWAGAPTFVWGHGLTSNRENEDRGSLLDWSRLAITCRTLRYDARGHGRTSATTDAAASSWKSLAQDQLALADALGIDRYIAGGASMGCGTALHAAVLAPQRITALVLVIPPTAWETRREQVAVWETMAGFVETAGIDALVEASASIAMADPLIGRTEVTAESERNFRATDPARLAALFRGAAHADLPTRDQIAAIAVPVLILAWSGDNGHPVSTANELHRLMPQSALSIAGTWSELQAWTDQVNAFLDDTGR